MPREASLSKIEAAAAFGATVESYGDSVEQAVQRARELSEGEGLTFVHPFDDPDVIAGQGTMGLELVEQVPDLARVIVPLGGGGLASGVAVAVKSLRPEVAVVGVQAEACAPFPGSLAQGAPVAATGSLTIADGIAVKRPGVLTLRLVGRWLDGVEVVSEEEIVDAVGLLLERSKLVVEGAGAVGVAALLAGRVAPAPTGTTVAILSGGNIDIGLLAGLARYRESRLGRRLVLLTRVGDRPGSLARLLAVVGDAGANLLEVSHLRDGVALGVRQTAIQLVLETRGQTHAEEVVARAQGAGYPVERLRLSDLMSIEAPPAGAAEALGP